MYRFHVLNVCSSFYGENKDYYYFIRVNILSELNLLNVETRVKQLRLNHVHIFFYNLSPQYLKENFVSLNDVHQYNTRVGRYNFLVPH